MLQLIQQHLQIFNFHGLFAFSIFVQFG